MIAVDSSVWIAFFRGTDHRLAIHLKRILDRDLVALPIFVRLELLSGVKRTEIAGLRRLLSALPARYPSDATWTMVEKWVAIGTNAGQRFGVGDLVIAAVAAQWDEPVWSLDSDFNRMAKLGWIRLFRPNLVD
jgi:predicted nucleic acid-binding protein